LTTETAATQPSRTPWATIAVGVYAVAYATYMQAGWGSPVVRDLVSEVAFLPLNLSVIALYLRAARQSVLHPRVRRALRFMAAASAAVFFGNLISLSYKLVLEQSPAVSAADVFYLLDYPLTLAALLSFPRARRRPGERAQFALDAAMVLVGAGVVIWYFVIWPGSVESGTSLTETTVVYAYPVVAMVLLYGVTVVMLQRPSDENRTAFALLCGGVLLSIAADLTFGLIQLDVGHRGMAWTDVVYLLVYIGLIGSGEVYNRWPVPARPDPIEEEAERGSTGVSAFPYITVAVTYGLLLVTAFLVWSEPMSGLALGAVAITVLVVVRQYLAVRQNAELLAAAAERRTEARFRSLVQHSSDVIFVVEADSRIRFVSPSVERVFGHDPDALVGTLLRDLVHPDDQELLGSFVTTTAKTPGVSPPVEWRFRHASGAWQHADTIGSSALNDPTVGGIVLHSRDVTERKHLEEQLTHQAFHDSLTGLANRALFRDRVDHALLHAKRRKQILGVIFLDLDDFKRVNDSLGHAVGDELLIEVAERLRTAARATDTVARFGGDEFSMLVENVGGTDGINHVLERITVALAAPFIVNSNDYIVRTSLGVALSEGINSADDLLRNADMAMYAAKRSGKGRHERYTARLHAEAIAALETESALRGAAERGELVLHYQPILSLRSGRLFALEALLRWDHPLQGLMMPGQFVPLAEENGLIIPLGRWVLREAFRQIRAWQKDYPAVPFAVTVNISGRQLQVPQLALEVCEALGDTSADPSRVVLEITESVLMQQTDQTLEELQKLKQMGFRLAIDDFGTGYSSLSYLQRFPIDLLKIARPFVEHVGHGREHAALARAIIGLAETLRLQTIAEGIEIAEQLAGLRELGCDFGQGYFFAAPVPPNEVERILRDPSHLAAAAQGSPGLAAYRTGT
jgi:diguanylate cyclase (GGDEF)-like protein/PAS domain S-box-containing protein